jgi:hypothetical protein
MADRVSAGLLDLVYHLVSNLLVGAGPVTRTAQVIDYYTSTFLGGQDSVLPADSGACAGNRYYFAIEQTHAYDLLFS